MGLQPTFLFSNGLFHFTLASRVGSLDFCLDIRYGNTICSSAVTASHKGLSKGISESQTLG